MRKSSSELNQWQQWLSFSAFTLAGTGFEGSAPPPKPQHTPKRKRSD